MHSLTQLYNQALMRVGGDQLPVDVDYSRDTSGIICVNAFPHVLDVALSAYDWNFALTRAALTKAAGAQNPATPRWRFRYTLPAGCMRVVRLDGELSRNRMPLHMTEGQHLFTDRDGAVLVYVARGEDPARWPGYFAEALVWGMAAELSAARNNDARKQQWFAENFRNALREGIALDVVQQPPRVAKARSPWSEARFG